MPSPFDVICMGRFGVDIYPNQVGVGLEDVETFGKYVGGTAANVAIAVARHGHAVRLISRVGDDPFGRYAKRALGEFGVDTAEILSVADAPTPVTFCEMFPPDNFPIYFYRKPKAPDLEINAGEMEMTAVRDARLFWSTVTGLSQQPSRDAHHAAWQARGRVPLTVLDLDWRESLWDSRADAEREVRAALPHVTVAVGNVEECAVATGLNDPAAAGRALLEAGLDLAVIKRGPDGVMAMTASETVHVEPLSVKVVNGLGAGDGFGGALCHGLLAGWPLERTLRFANAAGAIVTTRIECSSAMPTTSEVESLLAGATA
jgi:5-dehydro-2-deoxygluconokinase